MTADLVSDTSDPFEPARTSGASRLRIGRSWVIVAIPLAIILAWVLFFARGTSAGSAIDEPGEFVVTVLDGLTSAGLYFIVASGFTLIFGLMRTVNMAHGALFLLAAYIAIEVQERMVGKERNIAPADVDMLSWVVPLLVGSAIAAVVGLVMFEVFLRWNHGQELRQALITLAVAVILADQMLARVGGLAQSMQWPQALTHFVDIFGQRYATTRLFILGLALLVGALLWLWLNRTRMGIVIRAGVSDQAMVRALGINIGIVFAVTFFVGSFLAGMGGVMVASFGGVATGTDGQWLLNSLVVVIIGGLGSIKGAIAGSLLYGMVFAFAPVYLPRDYTYYAIIFTFALLAVVLAVRPYGLFGRPGTE
jgi:branched-chain amino acid transport system permease protein